MLAVPWIVPQFLGSFWVSVIAEILIWSLLAASVNLLLGYIGLLSFGQALYFGFGMYGVGIGIAHLGLSFWPALPRHRVVGGDRADLGHLRGAAHVALLRHHHRSVLAHLLFPVPRLEAGDRRRRRHRFRAAADLQVRRDRDHLPTRTFQYFFILFFVVLCFWLMAAVIASPLGKALMAIREQRRARLADRLNSIFCAWSRS